MDEGRGREGGKAGLEDEWKREKNGRTQMILSAHSPVTDTVDR